MFGKYRERPDLTRLSGYKCQILKLVGLSEEDTSLARHVLWWKTYNMYVHQEIRQLRGRMNAGIKTSITQGKQCMCTFVFISNFSHMFAALLSGEVKMSAERRLTVFNYVPQQNMEAGNEEINEMKEKMKQIINIAVEGEGLENIRCNMDMFDIFRTFVSYYLIHFTTSMNWRYKACVTCISEIFTESDEALCILLIENNADDYTKMYHEQ